MHERRAEDAGAASRVRFAFAIALALLVNVAALASETASGAAEDGSAVAAGPSEKTQGVFEDIADGESADEKAKSSSAARDETTPTAAAHDLEWAGFFFNVYWDNGLRIEEKHKYFQMKVGARLLADAVHISGDSAIESGFKTGWLGGARQARIDLTGTIGSRVYYRMQVDVTGESDTEFSPTPYISDFYLGITGLGPLGRLEIGLLDEPISLGVLTSSLHRSFMEKGLPTVLAPGKNAGLLFSNELLDDNFSWALGVFRGQGDDSATKSADIAGRISGVVWRDEENGRFLHLGAAYRLEIGEFNERQDARPETHWGGKWIDTGFVPAKQSHLLGLELAGFWNSVSFQAEWLSSWVRQPGDVTSRFWGAYGQVSYFLTGEQRHYLETSRVFGRVTPQHSFSLHDRTWGALETTARYSYLDLDDAAVRGGRLGDLTLGVNWYLRSNLRLMLNYTWGAAERAPERELGRYALPIRLLEAISVIPRSQ